jgi:hypothetical protein
VSGAKEELGQGIRTASLPLVNGKAQLSADQHHNLATRIFQETKQHDRVGRRSSTTFFTSEFD